MTRTSFSRSCWGPGYDRAGDLPLLLAKVCGGDVGKSLEDAFFSKGPLDEVLPWMDERFAKADAEEASALARADAVCKRLADDLKQNGEIPTHIQRRFLQAYFSHAKIPAAAKEANRKLLLDAMGISQN